MRGKAKWSIFVSIMLVLSLFLAACSGGGSKGTGGSGKSSGGGSSNELADKQELNFAATQDIPSMNSLIATDTTSFQNIYMVTSGLYMFKDEKPEPDMAAGPPEVTNDGKTYTFKIRDDAKWSNGDPVTAGDFVYAWQKLIDSKTGSQYGNMPVVANIKNAAKIYDPNSDMHDKVDQLGVKALDDKTLQVQLEKPTAYFLSLMAFGPFFPQDKNFAEKQGKNYALEPSNMVYNGAYVMKEWKHGVGWTLEKNPDYWDAKNITIDKVNYKIVKDIGTRVKLYKTDRVQDVGINADFIPQWKNSPELVKVPTSCVFNIKLNQKAVPALKNVKVRQAISMSIDRKQYTDILLGDGSTPANYWVPKNFVLTPDGKDFREAAPDGYMQGDKAQAKKLWEEAKKELGINDLKLEYLTTDNDTSVKYAEFVAKQIEEGMPGVKVSINKQPWNNYLNLDQNSKYQVAGGSGWCPDYQDPTTFLDLYKSDNEFNTGGWNNKTYDKLMKEADNMGNKPEERMKKLQEAEKVLIEDMGMVPLYQSANVILVKPYVKGLKFPNNGPSTDYRYAKVYKH